MGNYLGKIHVLFFEEHNTVGASGVHLWFLCVQSTLGANQFSWLLNDLARVNRAVTPWVIVGWHQPPVRPPLCCSPCSDIAVDTERAALQRKGQRRSRMIQHRVITLCTQVDMMAVTVVTMHYDNLDIACWISITICRMLT